MAMALTAGATGKEEQPKIGVLTDMSSLYAAHGGPGSVEAARMAIDDFGGAVLGKPVELISADHRNNPDLGTTISRQWYGEGVDAIVDVPNPGVALAVQQLSRRLKKIILFSSPASADITGPQCSPYTVQWTYDTYAMAAKAITKSGGDSWVFITADYAFGYAMERDAGDVIRWEGGKVSGSVKVPLGTSDFSRYLLQAKTSRAKIIGLAISGQDLPSIDKTCHLLTRLAISGQDLPSRDKI